jgi:peptide/nickel transport system substrate-binding protein
MGMSKKPIAALAATALAFSLAACGGDGGDSEGDKSGSGSGAGAKGGTAIFYNGVRNTEHWDPQRMYIGRDLNNSGRLFYRSLVALPSDDSGKPVADLATDTGQSNEDATEWSFTIKDGVKWEDGKPITCEDFKYGASRNFATDVIIGGPSNYLFTYFDIPTGDDGLSKYKGPYTGEGQDLFDKAVTCDGNTITYHMKKPWPDFPLSIAQLRYLDPYRQDLDKGDSSNFTIISDGPYKLDGNWTEGTGGTFVRNENWDESTDPIRKALPDKWEFREGDEDEAIYEQLFADSGDAQYGVTERRIPPTFYDRIPEAGDRYTQVESPYVDYLLPNFNKLKNPKVREALKVATDGDAERNALGGDKAAKASESIVNPTVIGYQANQAFSGSESGDPAAAKKLLQESGEKMPYPIKYTYSSGSTASDKAAGALKAGWEKAGFKVTLDPLTDTYYDVIQKPTADGDVFWGGWGADWPSISTVIPPLFDSRINLTSASNGQDYGNYRSDTVNKMIDHAASQTSVQDAAKIYAQIDAQLGKDVAYIPLEIQRFYFLHGSGVSGYLQSPAGNGYPDLGGIGVNG